MPFVGAVSLDQHGHALRTKFTPLPAFTRKAITAWAADNLSHFLREGWVRSLWRQGCYGLAIVLPADAGGGAAGLVLYPSTVLRELRSSPRQNRISAPS